MLKRRIGEFWVSSVSIELFSQLLVTPVEMVYATDIPHYKHSEYVTLRLCLNFITCSSYTSRFKTYVNLCNYKR